MEPFDAIDYAPLNKQIIELLHNELKEAFADVTLSVNIEKNEFSIIGPEFVGDDDGLIDCYRSLFSIDAFIDAIVENYHNHNDSIPDLLSLRAMIDDKIKTLNASNQSKQS